MKLNITSNKNNPHFHIVQDLLRSGAEKIYDRADRSNMFQTVFSSVHDAELVEAKRAMVNDSALRHGKRDLSDTEETAFVELAKLAELEDAVISVDSTGESLSIHVEYGESWFEIEGV